MLGDEGLLEKAKHAAVEMAEATYREGIGKENGGLFYEREENGHLDCDKHWWPQAEAMVGFYNAYQLAGREYFLEAALNLWDFIKKYIVDKENGEWFWKVSAEGRVYPDEPKISPWKCPYHNSRACFEILQRVYGRGAYDGQINF